MLGLRATEAEPGREMIESTIKAADPPFHNCEFMFSVGVFADANEGSDPETRTTGREVRNAHQTKVEFTRRDLAAAGPPILPEQVTNVELIRGEDDLLMRSRLIAPHSSRADVALFRNDYARSIWNSLAESGRFLDGHLPGYAQDVFGLLLQSETLELIDTADSDTTCIRGSTSHKGTYTVWLRRRDGTNSLERLRIELLPGDVYSDAPLPKAPIADGREFTRIVDEVTVSEFRKFGPVTIPVKGVFVHAAYRSSDAGEKPLGYQRYVAERGEVTPVKEERPFTLSDVPDGYPIRVHDGDALRYIWRNGAVVVDPTPEAQSQIDTIVDKTNWGKSTTQAK